MRLKAIWKSVQAGLVQAGRARVRRQLLAMDERLLADCGFSRDRLEQGVAAWPWRTDEADGPLAVAPARKASRPTDGVLARAAAELRSYTDEELSELGISRADIERAVRRGLPALDPAPRRAA